MLLIRLKSLLVNVNAIGLTLVHRQYSLISLVCLVLFGLWQCKSKAWIKEEVDTNRLYYHTALLNSRYSFATWLITS